MRSHSLVLLASLVLAPSLLGCAGSELPTHLSAPVALESSVPTTVFLETAGMELTPPNSCDYVVARAALDGAVYGEVETVRPACESACRVDTCRSMGVQGQVMGAMYYDELSAALPVLTAHCEQTVDSCMAVTGVVMFDGSLDELGLELPVVDDEQVEQVEQVEVVSAPDPEVEAACQAGDASACYALVDIDAVLMGYEEWPQIARETSLRRWEQACSLEPMVYCRGLELAIESTNDEGCGG